MATVDQRFITVLGPIKMEILDLSDVDTGDTFVSNLQRPLFGGVIVNEDNQTGAALAFGTGSASAERTGTITGSGLSADDCVVLVFGF